MENKEIMDRLLQTNPWIEQKKHSNEHINQKDHSDFLIESDNKDNTIERVNIAKYKLFCIIFLIFICAFWMIWIPNINNKLTQTQQSYDNINSSMNKIKNDITKAENEKSYLSKITENEEDLIKCINNQDCNENLNSWKNSDGEYNLSLPISFLQSYSLYSQKMPVDEKKILKNLKEYLIRENMWSETKTENGDILSISIWDPKPTTNEWLISKINEIKKKYNLYDNKNHFYEVPVTVSISFNTVKDLVNFLYNIEKKVIEEPTDRILYKIQKVSYDVVSHNEAQITEIEMIAYYYYDEKFENLETNDLNNSSSNIADTTNINNESLNNENLPDNDNSFIDKSINYIQDLFQ